MQWIQPISRFTPFLNLKAVPTMPIALGDARIRIEDRYIGFRPNTASVKPVHIANGLYRSILSEVADTKLLNYIAYWHTKKGKEEKGHSLDEVMTALREKALIDEVDVKRKDVERLRILIGRVVSVDKAVFSVKEGMSSFTGAHRGLVSRDRIAQDGGELVGAWLQRINSPIIPYVKQQLGQTNDPITQLVLPLLEQDEPSQFVPKIDFDQVEVLNESTIRSRGGWDGLSAAATTLSAHLEQHPDKLFGLRLVVLFSAFFLIRHLADLEVAYVPEATRSPVFLLDFSNSAGDPVARASKSSYTHLCQSIARFYSWAFANDLQQRIGPDDLSQAEPPTYKGKMIGDDAKQIWAMGLLEAENAASPYLALGEQLYYILLREAQGDPVRYLRQLGHRSGLLWPPVNTQPSKRFAIQQDMLEMLIRGAVPLDHTIGLNDLQDRLWERYGVIVGGRSVDEERLVETGIYQADATALQDNQRRFAHRLQQLDFASMLADGVMKVGV